MSTLIAGGCGFIGLNLAEAWLAAGRDVLLVDRNAPPPLAEQAFAEMGGRWQHARVDVTDTGSVNRLFEQHSIDDVIYAAAITSGAERERQHPEQVIGVNLTGLTHMIKAAATCGIRRLINVSSGSAYGDGGLARTGAIAPLEEDTTRALPATIYGVTKLASEGVCRRMAALTGLDLISVRLATIFGPWELDTGFRDTLSAPMQMAIRALAGQPATVARREARDWTYSRHVASALMALMDTPRLRHDLYHVSAGRTCSTLDWGEALAVHFPEFTCRLTAPGETANVNLHGDEDRLPMSPERLSADVGYTVPGDIAATAADFAGWMKRWPDYWSTR